MTSKAMWVDRSLNDDDDQPTVEHAAEPALREFEPRLITTIHLPGGRERRLYAVREPLGFRRAAD